MFCPKCGAQVEKDWKLCPKCGVKLILTPPPKEKAAGWEDVRAALCAWLKPIALMLIGLSLFSFVMMFMNNVCAVRDAVQVDISPLILVVLGLGAGFALLAALKGKSTSFLPALTGAVTVFFSAVIILFRPFLFAVSLQTGEEYDYGYVYPIRFMGVGMLMGLLLALILGLAVRPKKPLPYLLAYLIPLFPVFVVSVIGVIVWGLPEILMIALLILLGIELALALLFPLFAQALPAKRR